MRTESAPASARLAAILLLTLIGACSDKAKDAPPAARGGIARVVAPRGEGYAAAGAPLPGALDYLSAYQGRTALASGLWATRPLHERLLAMLGTDYERFIAALPPVPLVRDAATYYLAGRTERGVAAVVIDTQADSVYAIEQDASGRREYLERSHKPALPPAVTALLASLPLR